MAARRSPDRRDPRGRRCEFIGEYASPFAMLVIADLLGRAGVGRRDLPQELQRPDAATVGSTERRRHHDAQPPGVPLRVVQRVHRRTPPRTPQTTCSPAWPMRRSRTARCPRSSTWCASPPTCSPPGRRRRSACSARPCSSWPSDPNCSSCCATSRTESPTSSRRRCGTRARSRATSGSHGSGRRSAGSTSRPAAS